MSDIGSKVEIYYSNNIDVYGLILNNNIANIVLKQNYISLTNLNYLMNSVCKKANNSRALIQNNQFGKADSYSIS